MQYEPIYVFNLLYIAPVVQEPAQPDNSTNEFHSQLEVWTNIPVHMSVYHKISYVYEKHSTLNIWIHSYLANHLAFLHKLSPS